MSLALSLSLCLAVLPQGDPPDEPTARIAPMPVPRHLVQHRGTLQIDIDGSLLEWPTLPPLVLDDMRQISGTALGAWRGADDFAVRGFVLWDEKDLYLGFVVRDDWHRALTRATPRLQEIPPCDSIVVTFDPRRDTRALGRDEGRNEDREYWLAEVEGQGTAVVAWDRFRGAASFAREAVAVVKHDRKTAQTVYEARIPWLDILPIGESAAARRVLDLQVVANDFDEATDSMPQTRLGWTFGTAPAIDPGLLGSIMLWPPEQPLPERLPELPPPAEPADEPVPPQSWWVQLLRDLQASPPQLLTDACEGHPSLLGGLERLRRLETLEGQLEAFPRVDYLEYTQRVNRRMRREVAGIVASGLPFFWQHCLGEVRRAAALAPERGVRVFRLPEGGWLVRSKEATFAIDPCGANVESQIGGLDFALLTNPLDATRRNDQLLVRMTAAAKPFYHHIRFHLPGIDAEKMTLAELGQVYEAGALKVRVLGRKTEEGMVTHTAAYLVEWPDGTTLVHSGQSLPEEEFAAERRIDLLILSPRHPRAANVGRRLGAKLTVIDELFECAIASGPGGRVPLQRALELQNALRPGASVVLAPSETVAVGGG